MICVTELGERMQREMLAKNYRPYLADGRALDSPQNEPRAGAAGRHPMTGQFANEIAAGHHVAGTPPRLDYQPGLGSMPTTELATVTGAESALASAITEHPGMATVHRFGAAGAASPGLAGQLGRNMPSGIPMQPPPHVAPSGVGMEFRVSPPRAMGGM